MGSVKSLTTTGDNDPELFPEEYYRHYMYCDDCGSFKIEPWIIPENHPQLTKLQGWIVNLGAVSLVSVIISAVALAFWIISDLVLTGAFIFGSDMIIWLGLSLIALYLTKTLGSAVSSKIKHFGVRCGKCKKEYKNGSYFFTKLDYNPKHFTMADVPLPRNTTYWIREEL
ncbi:MAG: hypothetical protein K9J37_02060 [Saprospiraceae bacterium]|nr:hypothetical protein [Saprospiraceae bacterium]MCF8248663.1 hypothetical protein [Saprospiraceae bacterium]MCF8278847.1 hypothetical protein [Bacteroidales bacterium]MCF8310647.1 hypothetical protein [Saprospiraceae bacterium]MCF8439206.1 hypothetical protein [Saprospiraceae bacterium]